MKKLALKLGTWGAMLGMLAGLVELSIGTQIRPWIGDKENPVVLGIVTLLLSGMVFVSMTIASKRDALTNDGKLAIFLGVLLPTAICFTTVGRLWYLPGILLVVSVLSLAYEFWLKPQARDVPVSSERTRRMIAAIGSLVILTSIGLAFWKSKFGLFQVEIPVRVDCLRLEILPMDFVRRTALTNGAMLIENIESSQVMVVYILLIVGAVLALISSLTSSRLFTKIGGAVVLIGLLLFLIWLPSILSQAQYIPEYPCLLKSLGWGWYLSVTGMVMILSGVFSHLAESAMYCVRIVRQKKRIVKV
jgi:hypothetical protein